MSPWTLRLHDFYQFTVSSVDIVLKCKYCAGAPSLEEKNYASDYNAIGERACLTVVLSNHVYDDVTYRKGCL